MSTVVDGLSALALAMQAEPLRRFLSALVSLCRRRQIPLLLTATTSETETHNELLATLAAVTDTSVSLRYDERDGYYQRALTIPKMRGSAHDSRLVEFRIDENGLQVLNPVNRPGFQMRTSD